MKTKILFLTALVSSVLTAVSVDDACISFSTQGPDTYRDGTPVLDGECYALVWSADGVFEGIDAAGNCVDANDKIVLVAPIAKDGKCPRVLFQVPSEVRGGLSGGKYAVCLLDTRVKTESGVKPAGTKNGRAEVLNGYGTVVAELKVGASMAKVQAIEDTSKKEGNVASNLSATPVECEQPRIKNMRMDGDNVYITVENLPGFMRVQGGKSVSAFDSTGVAEKTSGSEEDVILVAPKSGNSGFYKVIRSK